MGSNSDDEGWQPTGQRTLNKAHKGHSLSKRKLVSSRSNSSRVALHFGVSDSADISLNPARERRCFDFLFLRELPNAAELTVENFLLPSAHFRTLSAKSIKQQASKRNLALIM